MTPAIISMIDDTTFENPHISGEKLAHQILQHLGIRIHATSINKVRAQLHYSFKHHRKKPNLNGAQMEARFDFCTNALKDSSIKWEESVVFSDESRFCLNDDSRRLLGETGCLYRKKHLKMLQNFPKEF